MSETIKNIQFNNSKLKDGLLTAHSLLVPVSFFNFEKPKEEVVDMIDISMCLDSISIKDEIDEWLLESNIQLSCYNVVLSNFYDIHRNIKGESLNFILYFKSESDLLCFKLKWL